MTTNASWSSENVARVRARLLDWIETAVDTGKVDVDGELARLLPRRIAGATRFRAQIGGLASGTPTRSRFVLFEARPAGLTFPQLVRSGELTPSQTRAGLACLRDIHLRTGLAAPDPGRRRTATGSATDTAELQAYELSIVREKLTGDPPVHHRRRRPARRSPAERTVDQAPQHPARLGRVHARHHREYIDS
ncbi:DUF6192 family protein [Streptomyces sp. CA-249302]|uniref:DUF6192 family protein n=1 Tax=Streptomyces sp. CA-249302 TaxID=3240058 RepID=UPI003D90BA79